MRKLLPLLALCGLLVCVADVRAASNDYIGTASTALTTYDSTWATSVFNGQDGATDLNLNGSGKLRTGSFKFSSARRTDGDQNSKSRITIAAGDYNPGAAQIRVAVRRGATNSGYTCEPYSSTSVATNIDNVKIARDHVLMTGGQIGITPINSTTTAIDVQVQVVNTVDVRCIINGQTATDAGSGGNDASGAAVLTGGTAGIDILLNSSTLTNALIDSWTDDVAGSSTVVNPISGGGGSAARPVTLNFDTPAANDDEFRTRAIR
jgi:hypothetical protein